MRQCQNMKGNIIINYHQKIEGKYRVYMHLNIPKYSSQYLMDIHRFVALLR